jgi:hypothetical protein
MMSELKWIPIACALSLFPRAFALACRQALWGLGTAWRESRTLSNWMPDTPGAPPPRYGGQGESIRAHVHPLCAHRPLWGSAV